MPPQLPEKNKTANENLKSETEEGDNTTTSQASVVPEPEKIISPVSDLTHQPLQTSPFPQTPHEDVLPQNPRLKTLRTYQGDMEATIGKKKESVISIATAEMKAREKEFFTERTEGMTIGANVDKKILVPIPQIIPTLEKHKGKSTTIATTYILLPLLGLILFAVGAGAIYFVYNYLHQTTKPVPITKQVTLVPYSLEKNIDVSIGDERTDIIQNTTQQIASFNQSLGTELYLHFVKATQDVISTDFLNALAPDAPASLLRSLGNQYMAGIYASTTNTPFIIFSSNDYGQTFSGMLAWESTMQNDLSGFFPGLVATPLASTSPAFTDDTFDNKNVRILRNTSGQVVLVYGFFDDNTFAITANEAIFQSLDNNYINAKLVH